MRFMLHSHPVRGLAKSQLHALNQNAIMRLQLLKIAELRNSPIAALTFGVELPTGKVAYPSAPTWIAYAGDHQRCLDHIPIAISTKAFCNAFLGQARVFRYFNAWVLAMLLQHSGKMLHTYPKVYFKASEFTAAGRFPLKQLYWMRFKIVAKAVDRFIS